MRKVFIEGDIVMTAKKGIPCGKAEVISWHQGDFYTVRVMATGKEYLLFASELETVFEHDMRGLELWKSMH